MSDTDLATRLVTDAEDVIADCSFASVRAWKDAVVGRKVIGTLPVAAPVELVTAAGMLPLGVIGAGEHLEIIRGDAYFQSYICHLPRSIIELAVSGRLEVADGFLFPSTCDVIRNLSGMFKLLFPGRYVRYVDVPQDRSPELGGAWYRHELECVRTDLGRLRGAPITDAELWSAIDLHDRNRALLGELYDLRAARPSAVPASEAYLIQRAGLVMPVVEHNRLLVEYLGAAAARTRPAEDVCRVVLTGAFCEQPPIGLLRTLERAGCAIVDDDFLLGPRLVARPVRDGVAVDPLDAIVRAFLDASRPTATLYAAEAHKGDALVRSVRERRADGVIFCSPSFCDPALLDRPMLAAALDAAGIRHTSFKYSENTGQFQTIREQAGTFADSLRLWEDA